MKITQVDLYEVEIPPIPPIAKYSAQDLRHYPLSYSDRRRHRRLGRVPRCAICTCRYGTFLHRSGCFCVRSIRPTRCVHLCVIGHHWTSPRHSGAPFFWSERYAMRCRSPTGPVPMEPHETAAEAEVGARLGFTNHKLKARSWNIVETVRLIKEAAGPDYTVGVDPNTSNSNTYMSATRLGRTA